MSIALKLPRQTRLIDKRVAMTSMLTAGVALGLASIMLIVFQFMALRSALVGDLQVQARIVGNNSSAVLLFEDRKAGDEILAGLALSPGVRNAVLYGRGGKLLALYQRAGAVPLEAATPHLQAAHHHYGLDTVEVYEPAMVNGTAAGAVMIRATLAPLYQRLLSYAGFTLTVALSSFALAWMMVTRLRHAVRQAETHLHNLAHVDAVTTLPNRHHFNDRLAFALERADRLGSGVGLLLLDLDNFKLVNDTLGHNAGDALLKLVAQRLSSNLRGSDVIFRIGGDEFVVIVEQDGAAFELDSVARNILAALVAPFKLDSHELHVSASIGVSRYPRDARDAQTLTRSADTAMYHAKSKGKNGFELFLPEMDLRAQKRLSMEAHLRKALHNGALHLHYQPQIDVRSGCISGLEVLARWTCPELGEVSPVEFIPVAEESGVIVPLGHWVLDTACRQAASWHAAGLLDTIERVAVNLSAVQARQTSLMGDIDAILAYTGLPAGLLELEITEGVLMDNVHANLALLQRFRDAGIHLSIDDFGTGYSSMAYLRRFPINQIKIDRSFVHDVPGDGEPIVTAIIAMAHSLHLSVVAEGVETAEQVAFLREAGCNIMQGYYFARPMAAEQLTELLRERRQWHAPDASRCA